MTRADLFCWLSITGQAIKSKESFQYPNEWFSYGHKLTLLARDVFKVVFSMTRSHGLHNEKVS